MNARYYSASEFYKNTFGSKVYKIALDAGCTCPNRDGTKGTGGCIFCSAAGSGDFAAQRTLSITDQIEAAKQTVAQKMHTPSAASHTDVEKKYIAYFQNFTNTYGNPDALEQKYSEAASCPNIVGVSIATRPDCLGDDILRRIAALSERTFVSIELGLQTANERTAAYIRRAYPLADYYDAAARIKKSAPRVHLVTHVMFGLPGETQTDFDETVYTCIRAQTDGIKFTVLYVLEETDLATDYRSGKFSCMSETDYFFSLARALELLPRTVVIHRLTGDGPKRILIAPQWTTDKKRVLNNMNAYFETHDMIQGKHFLDHCCISNRQLSGHMIY